MYQNHTKTSIRISYSATSLCSYNWLAIDLKGFCALSLILPLFGPALKGFNVLYCICLILLSLLSSVTSLCSTYSADRTKTSIRTCSCHRKAHSRPQIIQRPREERNICISHKWVAIDLKRLRSKRIYGICS